MEESVFHKMLKEKKRDRNCAPNQCCSVPNAFPEVVTYLPTNISSHSVAWDLKYFQRSMVKMVLALLKMEVREDMRAAIITAIIKPRSPGRENTQRLA